MSAVVQNHQVVPVSGEICLAEVAELTARLDALVAAGHHHLVLDLAECTLLTAAAVGAIATTEHRLRPVGGAIRLRNPAPLPARVLAVTGFDRLLDEQTPGT
jgi:anti-sigma B factor antagonist